MAGKSRTRTSSGDAGKLAAGLTGPPRASLSQGLASNSPRSNPSQLSAQTGGPKKAAEPPVSLDDYAKQATGKGEAALDVAGAHTQGAEYDARTLDAWEKQFTDAVKAQAAGTKTDGRSTKDMLAAIKGKTAPRFVARVGVAGDFAKKKSFGKSWAEFIFATEPADLLGCSPLEAMLKVGWTHKSLMSKVGTPIGVAILDTSKAVTNKAGKPVKPKAGKAEWPDLIGKATSDGDVLKDFMDTGAADIKELTGAKPTAKSAKPILKQVLAMASKTAVGKTPKAAKPALVRLHGVLQAVLENAYGANALYSGMGATVTQDGKLGAREVMVENNGSDFALTPQNHKVIRLGSFSRRELDQAMTPPPSGAA